MSRMPAPLNHTTMREVILVYVDAALAGENPWAAVARWEDAHHPVSDETAELMQWWANQMLEDIR